VEQRACKGRLKENINSLPSQGREFQPRLSVDDLTQADVLLIKAVQSEEFGKEIEILLTSLKTEQHPSKSNKRNIQLNKTSSLYKLDPFVH
jgi:uncharacterized HAD superfamily protein